MQEEPTSLKENSNENKLDISIRMVKGLNYSNLEINKAKCSNHDEHKGTPTDCTRI
jgi:hypothetical protein